MCKYINKSVNGEKLRLKKFNLPKIIWQKDLKLKLSCRIWVAFGQERKDKLNIKNGKRKSIQAE